MNTQADIQALIIDDPSCTGLLKPGTPIVRTDTSANDLEETLLSCERDLILLLDRPERASELKKNVLEAGARLGKAIDVKVFSHKLEVDVEVDVISSDRTIKEIVRIEHVVATSCLARGGLIIAVSRSSEDQAHIATLEHSRTWRIDVPLSRWPGSSDDFEQVVVDIADQAAKCILQGKDVLLVVDGEADQNTSDVRHAITQFLRVLVPQPKYILSASQDTVVPVLDALRIQQCELLGSVSPSFVAWKSDEPTSKFSGVPLVISPKKADKQTSSQNLITQWAHPPENREMQYQRLGKSAMKVSRIILGCMTFGNPSWEGSPWVLPEEEALPLLKKAFDCGINTWDTANTYSNGRSEMIIAKALETYSIPRSKVVIMTKLYYPVLDAEDNRRPNPAVNTGELVNQMGLSRKHIFDAVEGSLRRLKTSYIDVLQLHRLDVEADSDEIMRALHDLVQMGKVHYLGASSMYCWQLARLQYTAKMNGWTPFTSMQGLYNLLYREEEREVNPFCRAEGIGLIPWSPLARGLLARPCTEVTERSKKDAKTAKWFKGDANEDIIKRVEALAKRKRCSMSAIALAWLLHKGCSPIVGLNSVERIENIAEVFAVELEDREMRFLEEPYCPLAVQAI